MIKTGATTVRSKNWQTQNRSTKVRKASKFFHLQRSSRSPPPALYFVKVFGFSINKHSRDFKSRQGYLTSRLHPKTYAQNRVGRHECQNNHISSLSSATSIFLSLFFVLVFPFPSRKTSGNLSCAKPPDFRTCTCTCTWACACA